MGWAMVFLITFGPIELPEWLTLELLVRVLSAIYWGGAAVVAIIG